MMYKQLTREQRYAIYLGLQKEKSYGFIALCIGVSKSAVCREVRCDSTRSGKYVWTKAQESSDARRSRSPGNRRLDSVLEWRIRELIRNEQWSPRQISG